MNIIDELLYELYSGDNPLSHSSAEIEDGAYPHTNLTPEVAGAILDVVNPRFWLEIGSMVGGSVIVTAKAIKDRGLVTKIIAIDPFTGDVNMWDWEKQLRQEHRYAFLNLRNGRPTIYDRFIANINRENLQDMVLPLNTSSIVGMKLLRRLHEQKRISSLPEVVYLDSAHEPGETLMELKSAWNLMEGKGTLCGDDWGWKDVRNDVIRFSQEVTIDKSLQTKLREKVMGTLVGDDKILLKGIQWVICGAL